MAVKKCQTICHAQTQMLKVCKFLSAKCQQTREHILAIIVDKKYICKKIPKCHIAKNVVAINFANKKITKKTSYLGFETQICRGFFVLNNFYILLKINVFWAKKCYFLLIFCYFALIFIFFVFLLLLFLAIFILFFAILL